MHVHWPGKAWHWCIRRYECSEHEHILENIKGETNAICQEDISCPQKVNKVSCVELSDTVVDPHLPPVSYQPTIRQRINTQWWSCLAIQCLPEHRVRKGKHYDLKGTNILSNVSILPVSGGDRSYKSPLDGSSHGRMDRLVGHAHGFRGSRSQDRSWQLDTW